MTGRMSSQRFLSIRGRPDPRAGALPELHGAVLNPAGSRQDLPVLELMPADLVTAVVEQHEPGAGGSLVERTDEIGHYYYSSRFQNGSRSSRTRGAVAQESPRVSNETVKVQPWGPAEKLTRTDVWGHQGPLR